jgi:hypothetical protein
MITQSFLRQRYDYDPATGELRYKVNRVRMRIGDAAGKVDKDGYRIIVIDSKGYRAHRLVWVWHYGETPRALDHINRNKLDNRIENLRECTDAQNARNTGLHSHNTSGYKGVYYEHDRGKWRARARYTNHKGDRKRVDLGRHDTPDLAAVAYNLHLMTHHPDFGLLNEINTPLGQIMGMSSQVNP